MRQVNRINEYANKIISEINRLLQEKKPVFAAIDGRCGAGKTTLASILQEHIFCNVIHMDDFFLTPDMRTEERMKIPGGNVDYERVLSEVIEPLKTGKTFSYRPYQCGVQSFGEPIKVVPAAVTVFEGSYSCHPALWDFYDLHIFLDVDGDTQIKRIALRNGEKSAEIFKKRWIPLEESYFGEYQIKSRCELKF